MTDSTTAISYTDPEVKTHKGTCGLKPFSSRCTCS